MAKPRGRPKGTGYPEDEPILREMVRALRSQEVASPWAAAKKFADRVPGPSLESRERRLYDKIRKRRAELEEEIKMEGSDASDSDDVWSEANEEELRTLIGLGIDLSHDVSFEEKLTRLANIFRPAAEIEALKNALIALLSEEGLELSDKLKTKLDISLYYYRTSSHLGMPSSKIMRARIANIVKRMRVEAAKNFPSVDEKKKPDSGS